ncbi:MAG: hypothetical protein ACRDPA_17500 [Solirubrobacteraceae bacterium]
MATLLHLARWIAWQIGDHDAALTHPPAHITVFSTRGVEDF